MVFKAPFLAARCELFWVFKMGSCRPSSGNGPVFKNEVWTTAGTEDPSYSFGSISLVALCCRVSKPPRSTSGSDGKGEKDEEPLASPRRLLPSAHAGRALFGGVAAVWAAMRQQTPGFPRLKLASEERYGDLSLCERLKREDVTARNRRSAQSNTRDFQGAGFMLC